MNPAEFAEEADDFSSIVFSKPAHRNPPKSSPSPTLNTNQQDIFNEILPLLDMPSQPLVPRFQGVLEWLRAAEASGLPQMAETDLRSPLIAEPCLAESEGQKKKLKKKAEEETEPHPGKTNGETRKRKRREGDENRIPPAANRPCASNLSEFSAQPQAPQPET